MRANSDDYVLIYSGHNSFIDGEICLVLDRDSMKGDLLVTPLESIGYAKRSNPYAYKQTLMRSGSYWIHQYDCKKLTFKQPFFDKIKKFVYTKLEKIKSKIKKLKTKFKKIEQENKKSNN